MPLTPPALNIESFKSYMNRVESPVKAYIVGSSKDKQKAMKNKLFEQLEQSDTQLLTQNNSTARLNETSNNSNSYTGYLNDGTKRPRASSIRKQAKKDLKKYYEHKDKINGVKFEDKINAPQHVTRNIDIFML